jgi:hypothetical protein
MGRLICPTGKSVACVSSPLCKNIFLNPTGKSLLQLRPSRPKEGRLAIVTNVGWDVMDVFVPDDERRESRRRSRVVLMPQRWRQVAGIHFR